MFNKIKMSIRNPWKIIFKLIRVTHIDVFLSDVAYIKLQYKIHFDKKLDIKNPKTFNEKLQWLKLYDRDPNYTNLVDKYEVRNFVSKKIGEEYLIPLIGVWDSVEDINFDMLPDKFVLKCTHDSGSVVICTDKKHFDIKASSKKLKKALKKNYFWIGREWSYKNVKPRIICEEYLDDSEHIVPKDYKIYCFNGKPKYIVVFHDRFNTNIHKSETVYTTEWNIEKCVLDHNFKLNLTDVEKKPEFLECILSLAENLAKGIPTSRIDFYVVQGKIYFGEITFTTASGYVRLEPEKYDRILGDWISLPSLSENKTDK